MSIKNLTPTQLRQAANLKEQIEKLQAQLNQLQGTKAVTLPAPVAKIAKKKISAAGIARIKAAQKARWAAIKGVAKTATVVKPVKKARKKMSAEARKKIAQAAKARWAKVHAAKAVKK